MCVLESDTEYRGSDYHEVPWLNRGMRFRNWFRSAVLDQKLTVPRGTPRSTAEYRGTPRDWTNGTGRCGVWLRLFCAGRCRTHIFRPVSLSSLQMRAVKRRRYIDALEACTFPGPFCSSSFHVEKQIDCDLLAF